MSGIFLASVGASYSSAPTTIGQAYGGGYYAGKIVNGGVEYYLIVAPKASGESSSLQWKTANTVAPTSTITLNNGPSASASMNSSSYPAAQFCEALSIGGFTDWYFPARDELEVCHRNLKPMSAGNDTGNRSKVSYTYPEGNDVLGDTMGINRNTNPTSAAYTSSNPSQTTASLFKSGQSEAFDNEYWCSSEAFPEKAWRQSFIYGDQQPGYFKTTYYSVRAIRRVQVTV